MEPARKRIKLEEGEPSFSTNQCVVVEAHIKEEQLSDEGDSGSEDTGSEGSDSEEDSEGSEEYQSCESGGEEEIKPEPQAAQAPSHELSSKQANAVSHPYCNECRRSFQSGADIERHNSKWHYNFICHACDEGFASQPELHKVSPFLRTGLVSHPTGLSSIKAAIRKLPLSVSAVRRSFQLTQE